MYKLGACLHLPVSRQVRGTEKCFSSLADIRSIADVLRLVVFLFGYFFFAKCVKFPSISYSFITYKLYKNEANFS